jgi:hypothetical protein
MRLNQTGAQAGIGKGKSKTHATLLIEWSHSTGTWGFAVKD